MGLFKNVICTQCGAPIEDGNTCKYCGSTIVSPCHSTDANYPEIQTWDGLYRADYSLVHDNVKGEKDFARCYVIERNKTGEQGLIDAWGHFVIPCIYNQVTAYLDYELCCVSKDGEIGVFDFDGNTIISLCGTVADHFEIQYGFIVSRNTIFDLYGKVKTQIPSESRIYLLSPVLATTCPDNKCLYDVNTGIALLSSEYKVEKKIEEDFFLVSRFINDVTRYGLYQSQTNCFLLPVEYLSIHRLENKTFEAKIQIRKYSDSISIKTTTFSIKNNSIVIEKEECQAYKRSSGSGCLVVIIAILFIPMSFFYMI